MNDQPGSSTKHKKKDRLSNIGTVLDKDRNILNLKESYEKINFYSFCLRCTFYPDFH